jgi:phosphohistidine phosphatase
MDLYVLRHGKAEPAGPGIDDHARALTGKGKDEIARLAQWLSRREERVDLILTSPRRRALQTAEIVAGTLKIREKLHVSEILSSGFSAEMLSRELTAVKDPGNIMLVGHEPDLSSFVGYIISGEEGASIKMAKGGLARIRDYRPGEMPGGELTWLVSPDLLKE